MASTAILKTQMKREGLSLLAPLSAEVEALHIRTAEDYLEADAILSRVRQARSKWEAKIQPAIEPIRKGLDALYALNREVDGPLEAMEKAIKAEMKGYKVEEARQLREAEAVRQREADRLRVELEQKAKAELNARTAPMRAKLRAAREALEEQAADAEEAVALSALKASGSVGRKVKKWRVVDFSAARFDEDAIIPVGVIVVDSAAVNAVFKQDPDAVAKWPGFEVYTDIEIAGRR